MAPGLSTARLRVASTTYWRRRRQRGVQPTQGLPTERAAMGPHRTKKKRVQRRRGTKPHSTRSPRDIPTEERPRRAPPPERLRALNAGGRRGEEGGGGPPTQQRAPTTRRRGMGGPPDTEARDPPMRDRAQDEEPPPPSPSSERKLRAGRRGWGTGCANLPRAGRARRKGGTPPNNSMRSQRTVCQ